MANKVPTSSVVENKWEYTVYIYLPFGKLF